jgi:hypothetical protein
MKENSQCNCIVCNEESVPTNIVLDILKVSPGPNLEQKQAHLKHAILSGRLIEAILSLV